MADSLGVQVEEAEEEGVGEGGGNPVTCWEGASLRGVEVIVSARASMAVPASTAFCGVGARMVAIALRAWARKLTRGVKSCTGGGCGGCGPVGVVVGASRGGGGDGSGDAWGRGGKS